MSYFIVLPSIHPPYLDQCVDGMHEDLRRHLLIVNNAPPWTNLGVAASWNLGARQVLKEQRDWLIVCSAATRFGSAGGRDFVDALDAHRDAWVVEPAGQVPVVGWHFLAWSRVNVLERVGLFDENYWPAYGEDQDISFRILQAANEDGAPPDFWPKVNIDASLAMVNHGVQLAGVEWDQPKLWRYYRKKWGGSFGRETFTRPFGDMTRSLGWWPTPPDRRSIIEERAA